MKRIEKQTQAIIEKSVKFGFLQERNRIIQEIKTADLPVGIWPLIRGIINPQEDNKHNHETNR